MKRFTVITLCLFIALSTGLSISFAAQYDPEIYQAQKALKARGYNPGTPDGLWGKSTESAIKHFQLDAELTITGKLDEQTKAKLGIISTTRLMNRNQSTKERRLALVIGNSAYKSSPLKNSVNDAQDMADALKVLGFNVIEEIDADRKEMEDAIRQFGKELRGGGVGIFYYAGHGIQAKGRNYLIPVGARIESESDARYQAVDAGMVLGKMEDAGNDLNIVILDACRDNPFSRSFRSREQGLAKMDAPKGSLIAYATAPGSVAADGAGRNGIYTKYLLKHMKRPGLTIERVLKFTRNDVMEETGEKQVPWESSSLRGDFYFVSSRAVVPMPSPTPFEKLASSGPKVGDVWKDPVTGMGFVWVPKGCYEMGSRSGDSDEKPVHEVCLDGFWMGKYEVTNEQYRKYKSGHNSKDYKGRTLNGGKQPAVNVDWNDAKAFAKWLTEQNNYRYEFRLPNEAEWEYAARAGTATARYWGEDSDDACQYANVVDQTAKRIWSDWSSHNCDDGYAVTAPVGSFQPNAFGLYDMLGNIWEWCEDIYGKNAFTKHLRVFRGSGWSDGPGNVRSAIRLGLMPDRRYGFVGFRLLRTP